MNINKLLQEREINTRKIIRIIDIFNRKLIENKSKKRCYNEHEYGYSPHINQGPCRFCYGYILKTKYELFLESCGSNNNNNNNNSSQI